MKFRLLFLRAPAYGAQRGHAIEKLPHWRTEANMEKLFSLLFATLITIITLAHESVAQTSGAPSKTGTRLITLGTAGGPSTRPSTPGAVVQSPTVNGTLYVVDAGDGVCTSSCRSWCRLREIGTIFITHHHDDHTAGLGTLMSYAWVDNVPSRSMSTVRPGQQSWSRPPCSTSPLALRSGLPTEVHNTDSSGVPRA